MMVANRMSMFLKQCCFYMDNVLCTLSVDITVSITYLSIRTAWISFLSVIAAKYSLKIAENESVKNKNTYWGTRWEIPVDNSKWVSWKQECLLGYTLRTFAQKFDVFIWMISYAYYALILSIVNTVRSSDKSQLSYCGLDFER